MIGAYTINALKQLQKNKARSALTMLGIIIGIGSVIFIMSSGEVAKNYLLGEITKFGTNVVEVAPLTTFGAFGGGESDIVLTDSDVEAIQHSTLLPEVTAISAAATSVETLEYNGKSTNITVNGDRIGGLDANNLSVKAGRFFNEADIATREKVIVIGEDMIEDFFDNENVLGERVKVGGEFFKIIGITESISSGIAFAPSFTYAPITTVRDTFIDPAEHDEVEYILIEFEEGTEIDSFTSRVKFELNRNHGLSSEDDEVFLVVSREAGLEVFNNILLAVQAFVSAVASISLIVGGIGIMNIMLVTVSERTKEIGLRKAIGAKNHSITTQFLIESIVLTTVGGIVGIILGLGLTYSAVFAANYFQPDWGITFVLVPQAIVIATGVAVITGLIFGIYPAVKASRLHPIEALRYE